MLAWLRQIDLWMDRPFARRAARRRQALLKRQMLAADGIIIGCFDRDTEEELRDVWEEACREAGRPWSPLTVQRPLRSWPD